MTAILTVPAGLEGVVVAETAISDIDGVRGRLSYRGLPIQKVVERFSRWEDLLPWLVLGSSYSSNAIQPHFSPVNATVDSRPMVRLMQIILATHRGWPAPLEELRWVAGLPAVLVGEHPERYSSVAAAYLAGLREGKAPSPLEEQALNAYWVMAAEHGLNASTFAVRVAASTATPLPLALTAGLAALAGPLHGGAPEGVLSLLDDAEHVDNLEQWLEEKVTRGERLMGFGHRVYQTRDPRAEALSQVFKELAAENATVHWAAEVEAAALAVLRRLKPHRPLATNVEFYAAVVLRALGIPPEWCPATFACARLAGYTAHYYEQRKFGKLIRPLSVYRERNGNP